MGIVLMLHSIVRWVIVVVALVAIVRFTLGWLRHGQYGGMERGLASGFSGLMDAQVLLGIIFLLWSGLTGAGFPAYRLEHAGALIVAAIVAHLPLRWKNAPDAIRYRNTLAAVVGSLALVVFGVALLPQGWTLS